MRLAAVLATMIAVAALCVRAAGFAASTQLPENFTSEIIDYEEGRAIYRSECADCHGPDGNWVEGTDIASGEFGSDVAGEAGEALVRTIVAGVPGSPMGPSGLTAFEARTVGGYLGVLGRERLSIDDADPERGRTLVGEHGCLGCHTIGTRGGLVGPDLSGIGALRGSADLLESILEPAAEVRTENRFVEASFRNGQTIRGRLLNQDTISVQMLAMDERLVAIDKADLDRLEFIGSPMPAFGGRMSDEDLRDVVAYLASLHGR